GFHVTGVQTCALPISVGGERFGEVAVGVVEERRGEQVGVEGVGEGHRGVLSDDEFGCRGGGSLEVAHQVHFEVVGEGGVAAPYAAPASPHLRFAAAPGDLVEVDVDEVDGLAGVAGGEVVDGEVGFLVDGVESPAAQLLDLVEAHLAEPEHFYTEVIAYNLVVEGVGEQRQAQLVQ